MDGHIAGLSVCGLTRQRGRALILDGLNLVPASGKLTAIIGPAGSGKSTLLRILAGFERARGAIMFEGRDLASLPPHRRGFGVVQQDDALFPHLDLAGNVALPLRVRRLRPADRARLIDEALDQWGLAPYARMRPVDAGAALCQRAMLARATVFGPPLLLLDEPFSHQTPAGRDALAADLRRVHTLLGTTTLLATRRGEDVMGVADRVAVLRGGAIEQHGTPLDVADRPCNAYVAGLLGEANQLSGVVRTLEDDIAQIRLLCGPTVEAAAGPLLQPGDVCQMTIRPDRIAVAAVPAAEMGEGAIDATLIETQFLGEAYRLRLLIGSGTALVVRRPAAAGLRGLAIGRAASIAWQPHHAQVSRAEAPTLLA